MSSTPCNQDHNYFIAEVVGVPSEGTVHVLALCRSCNDFKQHTAIVSSKGTEIRLLREEKTQKTE
jgi:hypothetical protein